VETVRGKGGEESERVFRSFMVERYNDRKQKRRLGWENTKKNTHTPKKNTQKHTTIQKRKLTGAGPEKEHLGLLKSQLPGGGGKKKGAPSKSTKVQKHR